LLTGQIVVENPDKHHMQEMTGCYCGETAFCCVL